MQDKDPRYKSGTCLTKTNKEEARDCLIDLLDIAPEVSEAFEEDIMKMSIWAITQLRRQIEAIRK